MLKRFATVSILWLLVLLPNVYAKIQYFGVDTKLTDSLAIVDLTVLNPKENFTLKVFEEVKNITSNSNCILEEGKIKCQVRNVTALNLHFVSSSVVVENELHTFHQQFILPEDVTRLTSTVTLPVGMVVANTSDAVYPEKVSTLSNGRNIIVYWELTNVSSLQPISFQVKYQPTSSKEFPISTIILIIVSIAIVVILVGIVFFKKIRKPEEVVLSVLDDYERKVFEIVKSAGKIKQRKVVQETGFSKAKVSRVVKSLVERGLIESERRGRTNILRVKKKLFRS